MASAGSGFFCASTPLPAPATRHTANMMLMLTPLRMSLCRTIRDLRQVPLATLIPHQDVAPAPCRLSRGQLALAVGAGRPYDSRRGGGATWIWNLGHKPALAHRRRMQLRPLFLDRYSQPPNPFANLLGRCVREVQPEVPLAFVGMPVAGVERISRHKRDIFLDRCLEQVVAIH